jgi:manganese transport protein
LVVGLWILCEFAICATDLAEVIGTAVALQLLFGVPLAWGVCITVADVLLVLWLQQRGMRYLEAATAALVLLVLACFVFEVALARPPLHEIASGLVPHSQILFEPGMLYIAVGIIGATVMPHNLYLHSSLVRSRSVGEALGVRRAVRFATLDVVVALLIALLINAGILILSAAAFHGPGRPRVTQIQEAYHLLSPVLGSSAASLLFGVALLASGKSSAVTATLTGQIVMEGFVQWRIQPWLRRLVTRLLAVLPALAAVLAYGESGIAQLLLLSQAALSLQLPFAVVPLLRFTGDRALMGKLVNPAGTALLAWLAALVIIALNLLVLAQSLSS